MKVGVIREIGRHIFPHFPGDHISHHIPKPRRRTLRRYPVIQHGVLGHGGARDTGGSEGQRGQRVILEGARGSRRSGSLVVGLTNISVKKSLGSALERGVPVVLNGVIGSARQQTGNGGPPVSVLGVGGDDGLVLLGGEGAVLDGGAELVAPAQAAGLARPTLNVAADEGPVAGSVAVDEAGEDPILLGAPRAFDSVGVVVVGVGRGRVGGRRGGGGGGCVDSFHVAEGEMRGCCCWVGYVYIVRE